MRNLAKIVLSLLLLFATSAFALTEYVAENATIVAVSVPVCQIFGDSDMYGLGVRIGIYLQWAVGLIGILFGLIDEIRSPRVAFNVTFATLLILLIKDARNGSFAMFEWWIVTTMLFIVPPVLVPFENFRRTAERESIREFAEYVVRFGIRKRPDELASQRRDLESRGTSQSPQHQSSKRDDAPDDRTDGPSTGQRSLPVTETTNPIKERTDPIVPKDRETKEFKDYVQNHSDEFYRVYLSDASGFGCFLLLIAVFPMLQAWVYWSKYDDGHRDGCLVQVRFFGAVNMYNNHWKRFMRAVNILSLLAVPFYLYFGFKMIIRGAQKWREREEALRRLNNQDDFEEAMANLKLDLVKLREQKREVPDDIWNQTVARLAEECDVRIRVAEYTQERCSELGEGVKGLQALIETWKDTGQAFRIILFLGFGLSGGALIAFIESTIQDLNPLDMNDDISSSTGQLLALLVGIFSTLSFSIEAWTSWRRSKYNNRRMQYILDDFYKEVGREQLEAGEEKGRWERLKNTLGWLP